jgi:hypothetical protein
VWTGCSRRGVIFAHKIGAISPSTWPCVRSELLHGEHVNKCTFLCCANCTVASISGISRAFRAKPGQSGHRSMMQASLTRLKLIGVVAWARRPCGDELLIMVRSPSRTVRGSPGPDVDCQDSNDGAATVTAQHGRL